MIVDIHTHVWLYPEHLSEEVGSEFVVVRRRKQQLRRLQQEGFSRESVPQEPLLDLTSANTAPEAHWEHAQNADLTAVLAFRSRALGIDLPNECVAQYVDQHPERFIGFACVDPNDKNPVDELEESVLGKGLRGLKLAPIYQHFDPTDPRFFPLYEIALRFPPLRIIIAHLAYPLGTEAVALLLQWPSMWANASGFYHRPLRFFNSMITAVKCRVFDKVLLDLDFSAGTLLSTIRAIHRINDYVDATNWPHGPDGAIETITCENWRGVLDIG